MGMQTRRPVSSLTVGDYVHSIAGKPVGATVSAPLEQTKNHVNVVGPRGGRHELFAPMQARHGDLPGYVTVPTSTGGRLVTRAAAVAVVEVEEEW